MYSKNDMTPQIRRKNNDKIRNVVNEPASAATTRPVSKAIHFMRHLSLLEAAGVEMTAAGIVGSTPLLGKRFPIHPRLFTPRPSLCPGHLDPFVVVRDAFPLPGLRQSFRSPSCAAKPGTLLTPARPRPPGVERGPVAPRR